MEIGSGIRVYFSNKPEERNIVFFPDGNIQYYDDGEMLLGLCSDEALYLLIEKPGNMIHIYPGRNDDLSLDSITEGFKWLYGTVTDEDLPVATELFRATFNEVIHDICSVDTGASFENVGDFYDSCYDEYCQRVILFAALFDALAASASGIADEAQKNTAAQFWTDADELYQEYKKVCHVRTRNGKTTVQTYQITNLFQLLCLEQCRLKYANKAIKFCINCGRLFIPTKRIDTKYCQSPSPKNPERTCAEIGPQVAYNEHLKTDPDAYEHRKERSRLHMSVKRAREMGDGFREKKYNQMLEAEWKNFKSKKTEKEEELL